MYFYNSINFFSILLIFCRYLLGTLSKRILGTEFFLTIISPLANGFVPFLDELSLVTKKCNSTWCRLDMDVPYLNLCQITAPQILLMYTKVGVWLLSLETYFNENHVKQWLRANRLQYIYSKFEVLIALGFPGSITQCDPEVSASISQYNVDCHSIKRKQNEIQRAKGMWHWVVTCATLISPTHCAVSFC